MDQQTTSWSSTLFILDDKFKILYKEHLKNGYWIAVPRDPDFLQFVVGSGHVGMIDDDDVYIGGPWQYSFDESAFKPD